MEFHPFLFEVTFGYVREKKFAWNVFRKFYLRAWKKQGQRCCNSTGGISEKWVLSDATATRSRCRARNICLVSMAATKCLWAKARLWVDNAHTRTHTHTRPHAVGVKRQQRLCLDNDNKWENCRRCKLTLWHSRPLDVASRCTLIRKWAHAHTAAPMRTALWSRQSRDDKNFR